MASKGKRTIWLTQSPTDGHKARAEILRQHGFHVTFLASAQEILDTLADSRPTCVLVDSTGTNHPVLVKSIEKLSQHPELSGTKFILSTLGESPESAKAATSENFRDIIPFALPDSRWLHRFQHATSSKPIELSRPLCEVSMNQMAMAYAPARVVWISETHMRIECRGGQSVGSSFQIFGDLSLALGVPHLSLTVESVHRNELMYRFSQALVCKWRVPEANDETARLTVKRQIAAFPGLSARFRAFVAIANPDLRRGLAKDLNKVNFEVKVALLRSTIAQELAYFSPEIVFLDEKIIATLEEIDLQMMASKLAPNAQVVVFGNNVNHNEVKRIFGHRKIQIEASPDPKGIQNAHQHYQLQRTSPTINSGDQRIHILPDHSWSKVELQIPARLTSLNPSVGKLSLPFSMSTYAAIRLEAPILRKSLGRAPYIKITEMTEVASSNRSSQFANHGSFYFADISPTEETLLSEVLLSMIENYYQKQFIAGAVHELELKQSTNIMPQAAGFHTVNAPKTISSRAPETLNKDNHLSIVKPEISSLKAAQSSANTIQKSAKIKPAFNIRNYFDPVIMRALLVFTFAMAIVLALLNMATNIDPSYYQDHGKQYSDFFRRMSDPSFRQKNPPTQENTSPGSSDR